MANNIPEVGYLLKDYRSVITTFGMNDYYDVLHSGGGAANNKYAFGHLETITGAYIKSNIPLEDLLNLNNKLTVNDWEFIRDHYLHEFTHTVELALNSIGQKVYDFHRVPSGLKTTKLYLLNQAEVDGQKVGIPFSFWKGEEDVSVNYIPNSINGRSAGKIVEVGDTTEYPDWKNYVSKNLPFRSDLTVQAIPYEGYRFVKWTDGVMSAYRHDTNIISYLTVKAIFEKI